MRRLSEVALLADPGPLTVAVPRAVVEERFGDAAGGRVVPELASVDWGLVVALRRKASERIAKGLADHAEASGRPMAEVDRLLMGRSVIRAVVREHAEQLSANGRELWPVALEHGYALAVVFGEVGLTPGEGRLLLNSATTTQNQNPSDQRQIGEIHPDGGRSAID